MKDLVLNKEMSGLNSLFVMYTTQRPNVNKYSVLYISLATDGRKVSTEGVLGVRSTTLFYIQK